LTLREATSFRALALLDEDLGVVHQQVLALHAGAARLGADQQGVVGILESNAGIAGANDASEQREGAVIEFHHHALERGLGLLGGMLEQLQDHGLILAQHVAGGNTEDCGITDLAGGAGHCDTNGGFCHFLNSCFRLNGWVEIAIRGVARARFGSAIAAVGDDTSGYGGDVKSYAALCQYLCFVLYKT
jgi:hypothetical protein